MVDHVFNSIGFLPRHATDYLGPSGHEFLDFLLRFVVAVCLNMSHAILVLAKGVAMFAFSFVAFRCRVLWMAADDTRSSR